MRARHRHFSSKDCGSVLSLDSRFINAANESTVSSWTDRSAGGRTAITPSGRNSPTLSAGGINGADTVLFTAASNQNLTTDNSNLFRNVAGATCLIVYKAVTNSAQTCVFCDFTSSSGFTRFGLFLNPSQISAARNNTTGSATSVTGGTPSTNANIACIVANFTNNPLQSFLNGASLGSQNFAATGNTPNDNSANPTLLGGFRDSSNTYVQTYNGHIGQVSAFQAAIAQPLLKRLEHAAAYSFKIACN